MNWLAQIEAPELSINLHMSNDVRIYLKIIKIIKIMMMMMLDVKPWEPIVVQNLCLFLNLAEFNII